MCDSKNVALPEDVSGVFCLALQNLNAIIKCEAAVALKDVELERVPVVKENAAASLTGWNLKKIDSIRKREESCPTGEKGLWSSCATF